MIARSVGLGGASVLIGRFKLERAGSGFRHRQDVVIKMVSFSFPSKAAEDQVDGRGGCGVDAFLCVGSEQVHLHHVHRRQQP